jgi:hypothetical protein
MNAAISARVRPSPSCRAALLDDEWSSICRMLLALVRGGPVSVNRDGRCGGSGAGSWAPVVRLKGGKVS